MLCSFYIMTLEISYYKSFWLMRKKKLFDWPSCSNSTFIFPHKKSWMILCLLVTNSLLFRWICCKLLHFVPVYTQGGFRMVRHDTKTEFSYKLKFFDTRHCLIRIKDEFKRIIWIIFIYKALRGWIYMIQ